MTRARFAERQDPVTVTQIEGVNYFQICLHEQEVQTQRSLDPDGKESEPVTEYEYDFNEFAEPTSVLEPGKVKESPSNYLGYREFPTLRIWRQHFMEAKHERNDQSNGKSCKKAYG